MAWHGWEEVDQFSLSPWLIGQSGIPLQHCDLSMGCLRDWFLSHLTQSSEHSLDFRLEAAEGSSGHCGM